ncbi:MAG: efflux RND transporter periplasmic adaptor subunit [Myxococcota bacterium]
MTPSPSETPGSRAADPRLVRRLWGIFAVLVVAGILLRATAPDPQAVGAAGPALAAIAVDTLRVSPRAVVSEAEFSGVVEAARHLRLVSETQGRVVELGAEDLDAVDGDQLLIQVDPLLAQVAVDRAQAAISRTRSELGLARTSLERQRNLAERSVASESALDDASNRSRVAQAAIREARANLAEAQDALGKKAIRAPFAGVLRDFEPERGEVLQVGQVLGELLDLSAARVTIGLSDRQIVDVQPGQTVQVTVEALPNATFEGKVLRVAAAADATSRRFPVEVEIPNPDRRILPGMVARVRIGLGGKTERMLVPREAVAEEYGLRFVFVLTPDPESGELRAERRRVEVREVPFDLRWLEVESGLASGERVATTRVRLLRDGSVVSDAAATVAAPESTSATTDAS